MDQAEAVLSPRPVADVGAFAEWNAKPAVRLRHLICPFVDGEKVAVGWHRSCVRRYSD